MESNRIGREEEITLETPGLGWAGPAHLYHLLLLIQRVGPPRKERERERERAGENVAGGVGEENARRRPPQIRPGSSSSSLPVSSRLHFFLSF